MLWQDGSLDLKDAKGRYFSVQKSFILENFDERTSSEISSKDELRKHNLPLPEFKLEGIFSVTVKRHVYSEGGGEKTRGISRGITRGITRGTTREKILDLIRYNNKITIPEMAEELNLTVKGVEYQLRKLREENKIRRVGPTVGGFWEILITP